jgi:hypothetical protein
MFIRSKLFRFLLPLFAYLLFFVQWFLGYKIAWYANIPEETMYFRQASQSPSFYIIYLYAFIILFLLFLVLGIIYVAKNKRALWLTICLVAVTALSAVAVWHFSIAMKSFYNMGVMLINLVLFVIAVYGFSAKRTE